MISAAERALVVKEWNGTGAAYPRDGACTSWWRRWPPGQEVWWRWRTGAARDVRGAGGAGEPAGVGAARKGVGLETRVGVCLERSAAWRWRCSGC